MIRGATSAFGQPAVKLALIARAKAIATPHERFPMLEDLGFVLRPAP